MLPPSIRPIQVCPPAETRTTDPIPFGVMPEAPPLSRKTRSQFASPPEASRSRQPVAEPKLPPVRVDPTLLPVDAYLGVPPKQFVL